MRNNKMDDLIQICIVKFDKRALSIQAKNNNSFTVKIQQSQPIKLEKILMQQQPVQQLPKLQSIWKQLQQSKKNLQNASKDEQKFYQVLNLIHSQLTHASIDNSTKPEVVMYDILKPITRELTNANVKHKQMERLVEKVVLRVLEMYCMMFVSLGNVGVLQTIKELLARESWLFVKKMSAGAAAGRGRDKVVYKQKQPNRQNDAKIQQQPQPQCKFARGRLGYSQFHKHCCQLIFNKFYFLPSTISTMKLQTIKQLLSFMYFLQDYIFEQSMYKFAIQSYQATEKLLMKKLSKQEARQVNKEVLQDIIDKLVKILHYYSDKEFKKSIHLLGARYARELMKVGNIEVKLQGVKLMERFASAVYYRSSSDSGLKDEEFAQWLVANGVWDVVVGKTVDSAIVLSAEYILKLMVNKGKLHQTRFTAYLNMIWETTEPARSFYFRSLDPLRLPYTGLTSILDNFRIIRQPAEIYSTECFYVLEGIARYGSATQMKASVDILSQILKRHYFEWKDHAFRRKAVDAFKYCFEKMVEGCTHIADKMDNYVQLIKGFIKDPNYLTLILSKRVIQGEQRRSQYALQKAAKHLIQKDHLLQAVITLISQPIDYKEELLYFTKSCLTKYKNCSMSANVSINEATLEEALNYPQIFKELVNFCYVKDCEKLMDKVLVAIRTKEIEFQCVKELFYKVNELFSQKIEGDYYRKKEYRVSYEPGQLYYMKQLKEVLVECQYPQVQQLCAQLIADVYTSFTEHFAPKGKNFQQQFMEEVIRKIESLHGDSNDLSKSENQTQLYGLMCLTKQMLSATQKNGVNDMKAHNSLIVTSMVKVKIWNNASYGDDVQKCYEKTVPSNWTLYQLLKQVGDRFKIGQHELYLHDPLTQQSIPLKMNGHTLAQLNFSQYKQLNAHKNPNVIIKKQPLKLQSKQLNPRFLTIIKEIFKMFQKDNKMGEAQIVAYIQAVTSSSSSSRDSRVAQLLAGYDNDKDGFLSEEDLIRFYEDSCDGKEKEENIWINLQNLHYRKDLRKFNEDIGNVEDEMLFRFYMKNSPRAYDLLFTLCKLDNERIANLAKNILVHLPTAGSFLGSFSQELSFEGKNTFQISYVMINVRYFLEREIAERNTISKEDSKNAEKKKDQKEVVSEMQPQEEMKMCQMKEQNVEGQGNEESQHNPVSQLLSKKLDRNPIQKPTPSLPTLPTTTEPKTNYISTFLSHKNDFKIFTLIQSLSAQQKKSQQQSTLLVVSINILRTLLNLPYLTQNYLKDSKYSCEMLTQMIKEMNQLNIAEKGFFLELSRKSLVSNEFALYEASMALLLLDDMLIWSQWLNQGLFSHQSEVRKITLNFLVFYSLKYNFPINFFSVSTQIQTSRCQEYYLLLFFTCKYNQNLNLSDILQRTLSTLESQSQSITSRYNPIMNGNLNLLQVVSSVNPMIFVQNGTKIYEMLSRLIEVTLSSDNRLIMYQLMFLLNPKETLAYMLSLIKGVKPTDEYQAKQNFVGLRNLGSTCYMNSILQQFYTIEPFKQLILNYNLKQIPQKTELNNYHIIDDFMYQLQKMYVHLQMSNRKFYYPKQFCLTIKDFTNKPINTSVQEDAHEFLNNLFDKVEKYVKESEKLQQLEKIFQGKTICEITCKECQTKKEKVEDYYHLALEVKNMASLKESFAKFISPEEIEDYFCETCEKKAKSITKQTFIQSAPEILIINLQRIIFDLNTFQKVKVHSRLEFPETLELQEFMHNTKEGPKIGNQEQMMTNEQQDMKMTERSDPILTIDQNPTANKQNINFSHKTNQNASNLNPKYNLKGVVIHSGTSQGGHYYSLIKVRDQWYKFNDETVSWFCIGDMEREAFGGAGTTDSWGDVEHSTNAYILFYEMEKDNKKEERIEKNGVNEKMENEVVTKAQNSETQKTQESLAIQVEPQVQKQAGRISEQKIVLDRQQQIQEQNHQALAQTHTSTEKLPLTTKLFQQQVQSSNTLFYKQLQIHQQSFFQFINNIYSSIRPTEILQQNQAFIQNAKQLHHYELYQSLMDIYLEIMRFLAIFYELTPKTFGDIGTAVYELVSIMPERTYELIHGGIDEQGWGKVMCTHNEISIRELYKVVLNKVIYVYIKYYGWAYEHKEQKQNQKGQNTIYEQSFNLSNSSKQTLQNNNNVLTVPHLFPFPNQIAIKAQIQKQSLLQSDRLTKLLTYFLSLASSEAIAKNVFKSFFFFDFWKVNMDMDSSLYQFCLKNNYLFVLLDLLMANQSPFAKKAVKRQDFPYESALPLTQTILKLILRKKNNANKIPFKTEFVEEKDFTNLNEQQVAILSSTSFYKKMMKSKYDNGLMGQVVYFMAFGDFRFSQRIVELFLIGLNKLQEVDDAFSLLNNIKAFLLVKDEFQLERIKWMLGIGQFQCVNKLLSYGLRDSLYSTNVVYVCPRYFIGDDKYRPALQVLYQKRSYFTDFQVRGIITLLQLLIHSQQCLKYVLSVAPPSYIYQTYLDWIDTYIQRIATEQHYGLSIDRSILSNNMKQLFDQVVTKKDAYLNQNFVELPVLTKIIGKNKKIELQEEINNEVFHARKWTHETFVLENLPTGKENLSLPEEVFGQKSISGYGVCFVENDNGKGCEIDVESQKMVNTLTVDSKEPLKLTFKLPHFAQQLYLPKGQSTINYLYSELPLESYLQIQILNTNHSKPCDSSQGFDEKMQQASHQSDKFMDLVDVPGYQEPYFGTANAGELNGFQIPCPTCTYLNMGRDRCEMCDTVL